MFGFSVSAKFNAAGNVFWVNMALKVVVGRDDTFTSTFKFFYRKE